MPEQLEPIAWSWADACATVDGRDRDRSALSNVPKQSAAMGYSHHHRKLRSRGGDNSPANVVLLTGSGTSGEHGWVHSNITLATILGYVVHEWDDPTQVPIYRLDAFGITYGWHLQTDAGELTPCAPPVDHLLDDLQRAFHEFTELGINSRRAADPFHL